MSNRVSIQPTRFVDLRGGDKSIGVRVFDDYGQSYDNTWDDMPKDDMEVLRRVCALNDEVIGSMLDSLRENKKGCFVGENWYEYEQIKEILNG